MARYQLVQFDLTLRDVSVFLAINLRKYRNCRLCLQWHVLFCYRVNSVSPGWIWSPEVAKVKQYIYIRTYAQAKPKSLEHCNKTVRKIPLPWSDGPEPKGQWRGTFFPLPNAHACSLHSHSMPEDISRIFLRFILWKKEKVRAEREQTHIHMIIDLVQYP